MVEKFTALIDNGSEARNEVEYRRDRTGGVEEADRSLLRRCKFEKSVVSNQKREGGRTRGTHGHIVTCIKSVHPFDCAKEMRTSNNTSSQGPNSMRETWLLRKFASFEHVVLKELISRNCEPSGLRGQFELDQCGSQQRPLRIRDHKVVTPVA